MKSGRRLPPSSSPMEPCRPGDLTSCFQESHTAFLIVNSSPLPTPLSSAIRGFPYDWVIGNSMSKTAGSFSSGISETRATGSQPGLTSGWPRMLAFIMGSRMNAAGGMVSIAPTSAPMIPKPRKSPRVIGSFCNSANLVPLLDDPQAQLLPAKPARRWARLDRVVGLIIYRVGDPRVGLHEAHVERHDRREDPEDHERGPVARPRAAVPEPHPTPQVGDEGPERGEDHDQHHDVAHVEEGEVGQRRDRVEPRHRGHQPKEPYRHPPRAVRVPLGPKKHRDVREHEQADDEDEVYDKQVGGRTLGEPLVGSAAGGP